MVCICRIYAKLHHCTIICTYIYLASVTSGEKDGFEDETFEDGHFGVFSGEYYGE